ncbi:MAG: hypothetical protein LBQ75_02220 [Zoogloeaceae bacterium]|jgi:hypothetical protein|nr:hypothetical protein [Zoogloeaceae bacterium]
MKLHIPEDFDFASLNLNYIPETDMMSVNWAPIEDICACSHVVINLIRNDRHKAAALLQTLYSDPLACGGRRDAVFDRVVARIGDN